MSSGNSAVSMSRIVVSPCVASRVLASEGSGPATVEPAGQFCSRGRRVAMGVVRMRVGRSALRPRPVRLAMSPRTDCGVV